MSTSTILTLNFVLHSLTIASVGWIIVRWLLRGAMRRALATNLALLFALLGAIYSAIRPEQEQIQDYPILSSVQETFIADWRVTVSPEVRPGTSPPEKHAWTINDFVTTARWTALGISALLLLRLLIQSIRIQRWAWRLRRPTVEEYEKLPSNIAADRFRVFDGNGTPCVAGWFRPMIAVPASAFEKLTLQQWRWLFRHENEHLRCDDTAVVWLHNSVRALLWWNPFIHTLAEEFTQSREEACDAAALGETSENSAYATFLLEYAETCTPAAALLVPMIHTRPARRLKARLTALMEARGAREKIGALFVLASLAFAILSPLLVASIGLATPAVAQEAAAKDDSKFLTRKQEIIDEGNPQPVQVQFSVKLIQADEAIGKHEAILSGEAFEKLILELQQKKGIDMLSAPNITMKFDSSATIEITPDGVTQRIHLNSGTQIGGRLPLEVKVALGMNPKTENIKPNLNSGRDQIVTHTASSKTKLRSGETLVLHLTTPKRPITALITASGLTPKGNPAPFDTLVSRVPPIQGNVRLAMHTAEVKDFSIFLNTALNQPPPAPQQLSDVVRRQFTLNGILTDQQLQLMTQKLQQDQGVKLQAFPTQTVQTRKKAIFHLHSHQAEITPYIGRDGQTIDLLLNINTEPSASEQSIGTIVTIWNGRTVILARDDKQVIFVTAWIESP
jgi:beta-lactamase regulating signal transducer with metallopeptidase domain